MPIITTSKIQRPRDRRDFYETPWGLIQAALRIIVPHQFQPSLVLDAGAGRGRWGTTAKLRWPGAYVWGIDSHFARQPKTFDDWTCRDYLVLPPVVLPDLILSNPPYRQAEAFIRRAWSQLQDNGMMIFLLRLTFLASQTRIDLYNTNRPAFIYVLSRRPSFTYNGKTDADDYGLFVWTRPWYATRETVTRWLMWDYDPRDFHQPLDRQINP